MPALGRGLAWLPDIAATLLAVVLVLVAVAGLRQAADPPTIAPQRQPPGGPADLVAAFWQALHPQGQAVVVVTAEGVTRTGPQGGGDTLLFVLSHDRYPEAVAALRRAGVTAWREVSVPPALGDGNGWNPRFLALGQAGVSRDAFPSALARILDQDGGGAQGRASPPPAPRFWRGHLRWAGNLFMFVAGLGLLGWVARARSAAAREKP
jgi:hypothetical protein